MFMVPGDGKTATVIQFGCKFVDFLNKMTTPAA